MFDNSGEGKAVRLTSHTMADCANKQRNYTNVHGPRPQVSSAGGTRTTPKRTATFDTPRERAQLHETFTINHLTEDSQLHWHYGVTVMFLYVTLLYLILDIAPFVWVDRELLTLLPLLLIPPRRQQVRSTLSQVQEMLEVA